MLDREGKTPRYLTQFIGWKREVEDIRRLPADRRLLTLTGPSGSGKTRLALEAADGLEEEFPDGIWFIELAELTEPPSSRRQSPPRSGSARSPDSPCPKRFPSSCANAAPCSCSTTANIC